jgi:hypothetical protein
MTPFGSPNRVTALPETGGTLPEGTKQQNGGGRMAEAEDDVRALAGHIDHELGHRVHWRLAVPGGRRYLVFDGDSFIGEAVGYTGVESLLRAWVRGFEAGQFRADLDEFLAELLSES